MTVIVSPFILIFSFFRFACYLFCIISGLSTVDGKLSPLVFSYLDLSPANLNQSLTGVPKILQKRKRKRKLCKVIFRFCFNNVTFHNFSNIGHCVTDLI